MSIKNKLKRKSIDSVNTTTTTTTTNNNNNNNLKEEKPTTTTQKEKKQKTTVKRQSKKKMTESTIEQQCNTWSDSWPQWRKDLYTNGWAVVPNVIDKERTKQYHDRFWQWIEGFGTGVDRNKPSTWKSDKWPANIHGIFQHYAIGQQQFIWDIRSEQSIIDVFEQVYNTSELLVSFDGGNLSRPSHTGRESKPWPHFDQGSNKFGFRCIQGFLNLLDCGSQDGGLVVYDKSHLQHDSYFKDTGNQSAGDWYKFDDAPETDSHFKDCKIIKVNCNAGDVVLWDSRTIHYASAPTARSCRMVVYVSYQPASLITEADLAKKRNIFYQKRMTSHWASENISMFAKSPRTYGNDELITNFRYDEVTLPVLTDRAKQLAGLNSY